MAVIGRHSTANANGPQESRFARHTFRTLALPNLYFCRRETLAAKLHLVT
jgi:hypothetical protein